MTNTTTATMEITKEYWRGKPVVCVYIRGQVSDDIRTLLDQLGYKLVVGVANLRQIRCSTPAELDAARDPLKSYFDK